MEDGGSGVKVADSEVSSLGEFKAQVCLPPRTDTRGLEPKSPGGLRRSPWPQRNPFKIKQEAPTLVVTCVLLSLHKHRTALLVRQWTEDVVAPGGH